MTELRVVSYGGGVQSTALLVLAARGDIDFPTFLFANVGDDSEHPDTLSFVDEIARPFAAEHGIELHVLRRVTRDGRTPSLLEHVQRGNRTIDIPMRLAPSKRPGNRQCTYLYKLKVVSRWLREHGASKTDPGTVALGISVDEIRRAKPSREPVQRSVFPLLELGLRRSDCMKVIRDAGLPVPRKSACWFCPFNRLDTWRQMRRDEPELFERAVELEAGLLARREEMGLPPVYLSARLQPLPVVVGDHVQDELPFDLDDGCDSGACFT